MRELEERILKDGRVLPGEVLKRLNHQELRRQSWRG